MDIWRSMNQRFNQRQVDPRVDLLKAKWDPFQDTKWIVPLLTELSDWRSKMKEIEKKFRESETKQDYELTFVADLHGLKLENYISNYLNSSIEVLNGKINVEFDVEQVEKSNYNNKNATLKQKIKTVKKNFTLGPGDKLQVKNFLLDLIVQLM
jgi:vitamin K-dependent gamma-carboxylase